METLDKFVAFQFNFSDAEAARILKDFIQSEAPEKHEVEIVWDDLQAVMSFDEFKKRLFMEV